MTLDVLGLNTDRGTMWIGPPRPRHVLAPQFQAALVARAYWRG